MSKDMTDMVWTVEQATRRATQMTVPSVPAGTVVGIDAMGAVVAANESYVAVGSLVGGDGLGGGAAAETVRQPGMVSWQVYWDQTNRKYDFHSPLVRLPDGRVISAISVDVVSGKTYYAHVFKGEGGTWDCKIETEQKAAGGQDTWIKVAEVGDLTKPGAVKQFHVGVINISSSTGSTPKPFDLSFSEEEVEIGGNRGTVTVPTFSHTVFFFDGEERDLDRNEITGLAGGDEVYLQLKRTVSVDEVSGARTYGSWESSLRKTLESESDELQVLGVLLYEIGTGGDGKPVVSLDKRDASIDLGRVTQTDGCSVDENTGGSLQISGFESSPVPEGMTTLAEALTAEEAVDANVLVKKDGKIGYLPAGNGIGSKVTIEGTDGQKATGSKIVFKAEDDTNITFKASADNNGTVTVKVGVYYRV